VSTISKLAPVLCTLLCAYLASAQAEPQFQARAASGVRGDMGAAGRQMGAAADGNGNAAAGYRGGFTTQGGAQAQSRTRFKRNSDGSASGESHASANGDKASVQRDATYNRDAEGSASAQRTTPATNKESGVTYTGSSTWEKGSGASRQGSCTDASGNTVACGGSR